MNVIEVKGLTKDYGRGRGIFGVSFSVGRGETLGFLGPNGAGKTTTLRHLMGFLHPDSGEARILGMDCLRQAAEIQKHMGYLPGEIAFPDGMRGEEFLRFQAGMKGRKDLGRAKELSERFELDLTGRISKMSKGTKQKLGIVCAFLQDPELLLLDEPTSGLDPLMQNRFVELLLEERARGKTILLSSHVFEETERTCGRAAILRKGRLAAVEDMERLRASRSKTFCISFAREEEAARFAGTFPEAVPRGTEVELPLSGSADRLVKALAGYEVRDLSTRSQTLEELFLSYYGEEAAK